MVEKVFIAKNVEEFALLRERIEASTDALVIAPGECKSAPGADQATMRPVDYYISPDLDFNSKECAARKIYDAVDDWGKTQVEGVTLREYLQHPETNLWDAIEDHMRAWVAREIFNLWDMDALHRMIKQEKPQALTYIADGSPLAEAAHVLAQEHQLEEELVKPSLQKTVKRVLDSKIKLRAVRNYRRVIRWKRRMRPSRQVPETTGTVMAIMGLKTQALPLKPILEKWNSNGGKSVLLSYDESIVGEKTSDALGKLKLPYNEVEIYTDKETRKKYRSFIKFYRGRVKQILHDKEFHKEIQYEGIPVWAVVHDGFEYYFGARGRYEEILERISVAKKVIDTEKPALIISPDWGSAALRDLYAYAHEKRIPILIIEHGIHYGNPIDLRRNPYIDAVALWGDEGRKFWQDQGIPKEKIFLTGCPKLDVIQDYAKGKKSKEEIYKWLNLDSNKKIVIFTSAVWKEVNMTRVKPIMEAMKKFPGHTLVIKRHPGDDATDSDYKSMAKELGVEIRIAYDRLYDLLYMADMMIDCHDSTAVTEAFAFGVPVLAFTEKGLPGLVSMYTDRGAAVPLYESADVEKQMHHVLENSKVQKELKKSMQEITRDFVYKVDGQSAERATQLINRLIQESKNR